MRVAIDARLEDGAPGGVQQSIFGLASGLASLDDADDEYLFLVSEHHTWLEPALRGPCRALPARGGRGPLGRRAATATTIPAKVVARVYESRGGALPPSDGTVEAAQVQLIHFMRQRGFRTALPNVYQPHDLQHVHNPEQFHPLTRAYRRVTYRAMARQATRVAVMTTHGIDDAVRGLGVPRERVIVVPWASLLRLYAGTEVASPPSGLPPRYLLFPAHSWPHKNHIGLVAAIAALRRQGLDVPVVLSGGRTAHWPKVVAAIRDAGVDDLVIPLGYIEPSVLLRLYADAEALILPTLYEGWGLPLVEALDAGLPVLCSAISPLVELAGPAALTFDPRNTVEVADAIRTLWTEPATRDHLAAAARDRAGRFSWESTARSFRAHYRQVLGERLDDHDEQLLRSPSPV